MTCARLRAYMTLTVIMPSDVTHGVFRGSASRQRTRRDSRHKRGSSPRWALDTSLLDSRAHTTAIACHSWARNVSVS